MRKTGQIRGGNDADSGWVTLGKSLSDKTRLFKKCSSRQAVPMGLEEYYLCLRCHRAYRGDQVRVVKGTPRCFYHDCDGPIGSRVSWAGLKAICSEFPSEPEMGIVYQVKQKNALP